MYRELAGTLMFLRNGVLPHVSFAASKMQQKIRLFKVRHLFEANQMTCDLLKLDPHIKLINPPAMADIGLVRLSDASHGGAEDIYGQTGTMCGILA